MIKFVAKSNVRLGRKFNMDQCTPIVYPMELTSNLKKAEENLLIKTRYVVIYLSQFN